MTGLHAVAFVPNTRANGEHRVTSAKDASDKNWNDGNSLVGRLPGHRPGPGCREPGRRKWRPGPVKRGFHPWREINQIS
jgi:hypothetical protein